MLLVTVEAEFSTDNLDTAISVVSDQAAIVRAMPGCKHYAVFRNAAAQGLAILQHWDTDAHFEAYRNSDTFASLGQGLRPLMAKPPVTLTAKVDTL